LESFSTLFKFCAIFREHAFLQLLQVRLQLYAESGKLLCILMDRLLLERSRIKISRPRTDNRG
jgi:hypothetical protein